jgi:hypothetical protein
MNKKKVDPAISDWYRTVQAKRKNRVGGFSNPEVRAKALEAKRAKREDTYEASNATKSQNSTQGQEKP